MTIIIGENCLLYVHVYGRCLVGQNLYSMRITIVKISKVQLIMRKLENSVDVLTWNLMEKIIRVALKLNVLIIRSR